MKFQRDNSANRLTPEIVAQKRAENEALKKAQAEEAKKIQAERDAIEAAEKPLKDRLAAYPPIGDQLDMLWHDIDEGRLEANTTFANTWYHTIKTVKINNPLS
mgnify:CR=1 FL=1